MALTIVMYHYVRELANSRYPDIKGRDTESFRRQLDHIGEHYEVVTAGRVVAALRGGEKLPDNAAWLTFDDGYIDHYAVAFPLLHERGWQGSFFPPARCVANRELLDVNKVHFILASCRDHGRLLEKIRRFVTEKRDRQDVRPFTEYWNALARASRLDSAEIIFIKRILQHGLPEDLRRELSDLLFAEFVSVDQTAFAHEIYMSEDQLRTMIRCGMYVGSHGAGHYWMDRLDPQRQAEDLDASLRFLNDLGAPTEDWVMCYPYGAHNETLRQILRDRKCAAGVTTEVRVADPAADDPLTLPRLNTNDLPA